MQELRGMPVAKAMLDRLQKEVIQLKDRGVTPSLAIVRVGEREDDLSYEKGIYKRFEAAGALAETFALPEEVTQEKLEETIIFLNQNEKIHGILLFRPLPGHLDEKRIQELIADKKDVDCMTAVNAAHVFAGDGQGYPPCTPQAVMEILAHYGIEVSGKKVTVVGRSMVVGRPLSMLLLHKNATVTICHTKTLNLQEECRKADILIACAGVPKMITADYVRKGQIIIDVGIHVVENQLCGDVDYVSVADLAEAITPVPGGVGSVTTSVLLKNVIEATGKSFEDIQKN
ncbi:MAG: bifunctional 5,10-methylenetetrahydrofolate dehydrogenase/5,10-methenyltetrahydrofolate cyclohydrolase [Lachnospiraceae bacterium]|nr:bifunctional 5,10-methylenetetrahydrofolate dehydrogenase/5,10-methenyltetrahydrofolate cyclohydrolase [Lachnospiraceae bacterium]MDY5699632.1 bifunctional 5,10-methylenetetrahydrofolate dehydrogenase/5,10-methenyltetrahydrofolate cyclohydrolase [Lachnospiraceae bacterium]